MRHPGGIRSSPDAESQRITNPLRGRRGRQGRPRWPCSRNAIPLGLHSIQHILMRSHKQVHPQGLQSCPWDV
jgi:hypothetical protein